MKKFKILILYIVCSLFLMHSPNSMENKILFKVNNEIITSLDIFNELKYLEIINQQFKNTKKKQAFEIAKKSLIREKIKEIELRKTLKEIKIEDRFLENILNNYFKQIEIDSIADFENYFNLLEINPEVIKKKITIEVLWNQLIFSKYKKNVKIDKKSIMNRLNNNIKLNQYFLSEIVFNLDENQNLDDKFNLIKNKISETNFSEAALIYSISDTSSKGGELGWVNESAVSEKINNILQNMNIGNYSNPIVIPGGFLILEIKDIREIEKKVNQDEEIEKIIKEKTNEQLNQYSNIFFNRIQKNITINEL